MHMCVHVFSNTTTVQMLEVTGLDDGDWDTCNSITGETTDIDGDVVEVRAQGSLEQSV